jgi:hypothetical protein
MRARLLSIAGVVLGLVALLERQGAAQTPTAPQAPPKTAPKAATPAASPGTTAKPGKAKEPDPLPPAEARLWVIAPSLEGPWTLRIDNPGSKPVRVPADVRLLDMEVDLPEPPDPPEAQDADPKKKKVTAKKKPAPKAKPLRCALPDALRPSAFPEARALLLAPGESYIERFDPNLFCFGKSGAGLVGAATVRTQFGWKPPKKSFATSKKPPSGPFAVEGTEFPAVFAPQHQIAAPTMRLSYARTAKEAAPGAAGGGETPGASKEPDKDNSMDAPSNPKKMDDAGAAPAKNDAAAKTPAEAGGPKPAGEGAETRGPEREAKKPPRIVDENAPRLEISTARYQDAAAERTLSVTVTAKNAGHRPMLAALRPRMLSFRVMGPDGEETECGANTLPRGMPREAFRSYKPGETTSFTVLLGEICPRRTFGRPGLYRVTPTLHAKEKGASVGLAAYTAVVSAPLPALVRVQSGPEPFYSKPPRAVPTPRQTITEEDAADATPTDSAASSGDAKSRSQEAPRDP